MKCQTAAMIAAKPIAEFPDGRAPAKVFSVFSPWLGVRGGDHPTLAELTSSETIHDLERAMVNSDLPTAKTHVIHRFSPGIYIREFHAPAGTLLTSAKHRTTHPFVVADGVALVMSGTEGSVRYEAPHCGITPAGTHRVLMVLEDLVWVTFHATELTDVDEIAAEILMPEENPLVPSDHPRMNLWQYRNEGGKP